MITKTFLTHIEGIIAHTFIAYKLHPALSLDVPRTLLLVQRIQERSSSSGTSCCVWKSTAVEQNLVSRIPIEEI